MAACDISENLQRPPWDLMKIGIFTRVLEDRSLADAAAFVAALGYEALEISGRYGSNHLDIERVVKEAGYRQTVRRSVSQHNLVISAISNHRSGKLVLGPLDSTTDGWSPSASPAEKVKFGIEQMKLTAEAADALDVRVVTGFTGSDVWPYWYNYPEGSEPLYEEGWERFADRWGDILDVFRKYGVRFATEVHPTEMAYNLETAERAARILSAEVFGFNFDPSNIFWQSIDPVVFVKRLGERIYHCHAKDAELQPDELPRAGVMAGGRWDRVDRAFRFRCPGWGDINWRRVLTALAQANYDHVLSYEHEDTILSVEDGLEKCIAFLRPLIIHRPLPNL